MNFLNCCLFVSVLLSITILTRADADGRECNKAVTIDTVPFTETVQTSDFPSYFLQFSEYDRFEVKGKWYYIKGNDNVVKADTCDEKTSFKTFIGLYKKCDKSSSGYYYEDLAHTDKCSLNFFAAKDSDYYVVIGGKRVTNETFNEGTVYVGFSDDKSPDEHACEKAIEITSFPFHSSSQNVASEPVTDSCLAEEYPGIWYHFVGTGKSITAHTCNSETDFDTTITIHRSCDTASETCVSMNDDSCGLASSITFNSENGKDYYIFVTGSSKKRGAFVLSVDELGYQEHGVCTEANEVALLPYVYHGTTKMLPTSKSYCHNKESRGMWFHLSTVTTELIAMTCDDNSGFSDTFIDVYSDCDANQKVGTQCVQKNDDFCGLNAAVFLQPRESGYYIFVSGSSLDFEGQNFTLTIQNNRNKTNDRCWQASRIRSLPVDFSGSTKDMTYESTSRCTAVSKPRHGAWFSYINRNTTERLIGATTCNSENVLHADIEVYSSCDACQVRGEYDPSTNCSSVSFLAKPNVNYTIFVTAAEGEQDGFYHVDFYYDTPSPNQQCPTAERISATPYHTVGYSSKSTASYTSCGGGKEWQGLWYVVKGTGKKMRAETVSGSTHFDSVLELHSGCPSAGGQDTCIGMNDDDHGHKGLASSLEWDSKEGTDYYIFVRGYEGASGLFAFNVYETTSPSNVHCSKPLPLELGQSVVGVTSYASPSKASCSDAERRGLYYQLKAKNSGNIILSTCDSATTFDTDIEVYGLCEEGGAISCKDHTHDYKCTRGTILSFSAEAGKEYFIFVTGNRSDLEESGFFRLTAMSRNAPVQSSTLLSSSTSSSSGSKDNGMEIVEIMLVVFVVALVAVIIFTIVCCFYKRPRSKSYTQMNVPDGLDSADAESSTYVAPDTSAPPPTDDTSILTSETTSEV